MFGGVYFGHAPFASVPSSKLGRFPGAVIHRAGQTPAGVHIEGELVGAFGRKRSRLSHLSGSTPNVVKLEGFPDGN